MVSLLKPFFVLYAILFFLGASPTASVFTNDKLSAYQVLQAYDFPVGLLPQGVTHYELNRETGEFAAYLNQTCKFSVESYELEYQSTIRGVISKRKLRNLQGVKVHILFLWISIIEVDRTESGLSFSVGIASANFPVDNFYECPQCGCGLDCNNLNQGSSSSAVSSF